MISYHFNNALQILEVNYTGSIDRCQILNFGEWVACNTELPRELKILTDACNAEYKISKVDFNELMVALENNCKLYKCINAAYIQRKPIETALSTLTSYRSTIPNYFHAVFYSKEAAIAWLLSI